MSKRALYSLIPLVVLAGCSVFHRDADADRSAAARPSGSAKPVWGSVARCTEKAECKVNIIARSCSASGIRAEPNTLRVAKELKNVTIVWTIRGTGSGFTFTEDGISFKNKELSIRQFRAARPAAGGTEFHWVDQNTAPGIFHYDVKLQQNGRDCPVHDPIVVNEETSTEP